MTPFRLATIERHGREETALVLGERLFPIAELAPELGGGLFELLQRWDEVLPAVRQLAEGLDARAGGLAADDPAVRVLPPVRSPRAIFCALFNYYDFMNDVGLAAPDKAAVRPYFCTKPPHCVIGPGEPILLPDHARQIDWEVELGVVIGRPCRGVFARDALDYVAGYTIVNDLTARDGSRREDWPGLGPDWLRGKCFDTAAPLGPYVLPTAFVPDPGRLGLRLSRNGTLMQDGSTRSMIFSVREQIAYLSSVLTLRPGDVIATGTPAGVGWKRGLFLQPGDELVCEIEGIGRLRNPVVAPVPLVPPPFQGTAFA
jgi:2,4-didehydro-3-deoxy-L-rhamnonate hydrolase